MKTIEQIKQDKRDEYQRNKETYSKHGKKYYLENKEKLDSQNRAYYFANKEKLYNKHREWVKKNKDSIKNWNQKNRALLLLCDIRKRSKQKELTFDLTKEWIQEKFDLGICELSGVKFNMVDRKSADSPSIDRIDPLGGYTKENCRMILWSLNRALSNYGQEYMINLFEKIVARLKR